MDADATVMRIHRDGDLYTVTDMVLDKTIEWVVPFDDPKGRSLRFQELTVTCQGGLIRHGTESVDLRNGDSVEIRKDGGMHKTPK